MTSLVNHPQHYNMGGPIGSDGSAEFEVIKIIEDLGWGFEFCMANALKYVLRAPYKGKEAEDLQKARWYLERAGRRRGRVRALCFRQIDIADAVTAWGLADKDIGLLEPTTRLAMTVGRISEGDPFGALNELNVYMVKFGSQEEETGDASSDPRKPTE